MLCSLYKQFKGRLVQRPQAKPHKEILREFGLTLVQLQEAEAERLSIAITMGDGDRGDNDYVPGGRRSRKR